MGAEARNQGQGRVYWGIFEGKFFQRAKETDEGATAYNPPNSDKTLYRIYYDVNLSGYITGMELREVEVVHGKKQLAIELIIKDDRDYYISFPVRSIIARSFFRIFRNIDVTKAIKLSPYCFDGKDQTGKPKKVIGVTFCQNNDKLSPWYTKENPNGVPEMVEQMHKGEKSWDDTAQINFLVDLLEKFITANKAAMEKNKEAAEEYSMPSAPSQQTAAPRQPAAKEERTAVFVEGGGDDDLPF